MRAQVRLEERRDGDGRWKVVIGVGGADAQGAADCLREVQKAISPHVPPRKTGEKLSGMLHGD